MTSRDRTAKPKGMAMRLARLAALTAILVGMAVAGEPQTKAHFKDLPPEPFPSGSCKEDAVGYLGTEKGEENGVKFTDKEVGEYIRVRLAQGYSVTLHPQVSGKIFAIATCEAIPH